MPTIDVLDSNMFYEEAGSGTPQALPVGDDIELLVMEWIAFLKFDLLFGPDDPLFPATLVTLNGEGLFAPRAALVQVG